MCCIIYQCYFAVRCTCFTVSGNDNIATTFLPRVPLSCHAVLLVTFTILKPAACFFSSILCPSRVIKKKLSMGI
uniref:Uncharacterized protein n=1 Tax=Anguilla anguilla TaxID=7936 RepID=A0A0E9WSU7_ANGAN